MDEAHVRACIGEIIVAGFPGTAVCAHAKRLIRHHRVRNLILFRRNISSMEQTKSLTQALQSLNKQCGDDGELLICTDQENGMVRRLSSDVPQLPGNMAVGATSDPMVARQIGRVTARQLLSTGINMNLAPVLDVNNNPENPVIGVRSYGEDAASVAAFGVEMVRGLQEEGLSACGKHFPGHGDTKVDSHLSLPVIEHGMERFSRVELVPFVEAIKAGIDVIMTAHVVFPAVEPRRIPATISQPVLTGLLRQQLGYEGVITTDCLEMNAIKDTIGVGEGAVRAILAGADMVMVSHHLELQEEAIEAITQAVLTRRLPFSRLAEAAKRVRRLRHLKAAHAHTILDMPKIQRDSSVLQEIVSRRAVTVVSDKRQMLPLNKAVVNQIDVLTISSTPNLVAAGETPQANILARTLQDLLPNAVIETHQPLPDHTLNVPRLMNAQLVVVALCGTVARAVLEQLETLVSEGGKVVVIALQSPYDLAAFDERYTCIACYEQTFWMISAAVDVLFGITKAQGKLPVTVSQAFHREGGEIC